MKRPCSGPICMPARPPNRLAVSAARSAQYLVRLAAVRLDVLGQLLAELLASPGHSPTITPDATRAPSTAGRGSTLCCMTSVQHTPLAYIPSPPINGFHIGPLFVHFYGLMYVIGITLAVLITQRRVRALGGDASVVGEVAMWAVPAGIIGGRIYFDITTPSDIPHVWYGPFAVWTGGLGIWGGIAAGALVGRLAGEATRPAGRPVRRRDRARAAGRAGRRPDRQLLQPGTLRQARRRCRGRLVIDPQYRPPGYGGFRTFQPTFLYELIFDLALAAAPGLARPPHQGQAAWPVRPLRDGLLGVPHLRGVAAHRLLRALPRPPPQLLRGLTS